MPKKASQVVKAPNTILSTPSLKVKNPLDPSVQSLIDIMSRVMREEVLPGTQNVGIAAPQVGVALQVCIVEVEHFFEVFINPKITALSREKETADEGCMSVPKTYVPVTRSLSVQVRYQNRQGEKKKLRATGFLARVIQHELDHLNGTLILDRTKEHD